VVQVPNDGAIQIILTIYSQIRHTSYLLLCAYDTFLPNIDVYVGDR